MKNFARFPWRFVREPSPFSRTRVNVDDPEDTTMPTPTEIHAASAVDGQASPSAQPFGKERVLFCIRHDLDKIAGKSEFPTHGAENEPQA
jgi:hypothetical protein